MSGVGGGYFHPKRESLGMGCVISYAVPKHCVAQVHNSDAALNNTERAAAALSAASRHFWQHRVHFQQQITQSTLNKVETAFPCVVLLEPTGNTQL